MMVAIVRSLNSPEKVSSFTCLPKEQVKSYERQVPGIVIIDKTEVPKNFYSRPSDYILDINNKLVFNFQKTKK